MSKRGRHAIAQAGTGDTTSRTDWGVAATLRSRRQEPQDTNVPVVKLAQHPSSLSRHRPTAPLYVGPQVHGAVFLLRDVRVQGRIAPAQREVDAPSFASALRRGR